MSNAASDTLLLTTDKFVYEGIFIRW